MARSFTSSFTVLAAFGALAAVPAVVTAQSFHFTYSDTTGLLAYGDIFTTTDLGGGNFHATSGNLVVLNGSLAGSYGLFATGPAPTNSPSGAFICDNVLYTGGTPSLDFWGMLFINGGQEMNIWGNSGANDYSFWGSPGSGYNLQNEAIGTFVLTQVPTPGSVAMLGLGGVMAFGRRRRA